MKLLNEYLDGKVRCYVGDITTIKSDVIVNAANSSLLGGGGVDGAIHRVGGPSILKECEDIRSSTLPDGLPTGEAVITRAGCLPAKYVIHTVGPIYRQHQGRDAKLLASCYRNSLKLAASRGLKTIAFPAISTGVYCYPEDEAARVVSTTISEVLVETGIKEVMLVFFSEASYQAFADAQHFQ